MWPTMNAKYPKDDTPESLEGNAAHWVFAEMLDGRYHDVGTTSPNGTLVTEEMIEGGELVVDTVARLLPIPYELHVEETIDVSTIHKDCWGTPDIWSFNQTSFTLDVFDYKFGHRFVDEYENDQGVCYIEGILNTLSVQFNIPPGELDQLITVNFTIIQPRCYYKGQPVRTWSFRAVDLRGQINKLRGAALDAMQPNPTATTNEECQDCPGRHVCEALQKAAYSDAEYAVASSPAELPPLAAALELKMLERSLERLQSRVEGLRESVSMYIKQGHSIPWYRAEQGYGREQWTLPPEQIISMGNLMGKDLAKVAVKTPLQAKKLGIDESVISAYSIKPKGEIKLVSVNPSDARRVFGNN